MVSRLKERTAPLLKPQKKVGWVGWKATAHGASSGDAKSYSWRTGPCEGGQAGATSWPQGPRASLSPNALNLQAPNTGRRTQGPTHQASVWPAALQSLPPGWLPSSHTPPAAGSLGPRCGQCGPGTQWPAVPGCTQWQGPAPGRRGSAPACCTPGTGCPGNPGGPRRWWTAHAGRQG